MLDLNGGIPVVRSVVNVYFPTNENLNIITKIHDSKSCFYELESLKNSFYTIREHEINEDLKYSTTEYLIPISMAYIVKVGTMDQYKEITYYVYDNKSYIQLRKAMEDAFYDKYGYFYNKNSKSDHSEKLYNDIENQITKKTITLEELRKTEYKQRLEDF